MTNPTLEQRARELMAAELRAAGVRAPTDPMIQPFLEAGVRAMLTFSHTGVEQAIEACAKVADEFEASCWRAVEEADSSEVINKRSFGADIAGDIAQRIRATLPAQSPDDIAYAGAASSPVNVEGLVEASGLVPGPTWHVDADDCWTSEIQVVGGYYVVATIYGGTEAEAIARRDATLIALASLSPDGER